MLKSDLYINGVACISPANTVDGIGIPGEFQIVGEDAYLRSLEPVYKKYLDPMASRRMSRVVKMGLYAAKSCLEDAGVNIPGSIITGTGLGCVEDTEKFMDSIIKNEEKLLNPTPFIQSTHNTISSQIALLLKCHHYNITYTHRGLTFENALFDSIMLMEDRAVENVLLGGVDEITKISFQILKRLGLWKKHEIKRINLLESKTKGSIAGEGAAFFILENKPTESTYAKIISLKTINKSLSLEEFNYSLKNFLSENKLTASDLDFALLGFSGDTRYDQVYHDLMYSAFKKTPCGYFKHLCGEYHTSSSFALWLASVIMRDQQIPDCVYAGKNSAGTELKNILVCNSYMNSAFSFILLRNA